MSFGFFGPFAFHQPSEEEIAEMKAHQERAEMSQESFLHGFQRLFQELDQEQLQTLRTMFVMAPENPEAVMQWAGMVAMSLKVRFNICITCGVNHEEEILGKGTSDPSKIPDLITTDEGDAYFKYPDTGSNNLLTPEDFQRALDEDGDAVIFTSDEPLPVFHELTETEKRFMTLYHLDDLRDEDTHALLGFVCTGINGMKEPCGMRYPSIEDRMLNEPEYCSGCHQKMAHG